MSSTIVCSSRYTCDVHVHSSANGTATQKASHTTWYTLCRAMPPRAHVHALPAGARRTSSVCSGTATAVDATISTSAMARCHSLVANSVQMCTRKGEPVSLMLRRIVVMAMMASPIQKRLKKPWKSR
jgi:hypothetical protein